MALLYMDLGFYYDGLHETESMLRVVQAVVDLGGRLSGYCNGQKREGFEQLGVLDSEYGRFEFDPNNVKSAFEHPDLLPTSFSFQGIIPKPNSRITHTITLTPIYEPAVGRDYHPIRINIDASEMLEFGEMTKKELNDAYRKGKQGYRLFTDIIRRTQPAYGAITFYWYLACPTDMHYEGGGLDGDFYISESYVGKYMVDAVRKFYKDAYIEDLADGIYVSTSRELKPKRRKFDYQALAKDAPKLCKIIGEKRPRRRKSITL